MNLFKNRLLLVRKDMQFFAGVGLASAAFNEQAAYLNRLHAREKVIYDGYKHDQRKKSYLLGRLSAKEAIMCIANEQEAASIWIDSGVFHFPVVKCPNLHNIQVSISHCDHIGISLAFPEAHPMGIDMEKIEEKQTDALLSQLTIKEKVLLQQKSLDHCSGYTALFTAKEALSKVIRTGMMLDFKVMEIANIKLDGQVLETTFSHFGQYKGFSCITRDHVVSIVLPGKTTVDLSGLWEMISSYLED